MPLLDAVYSNTSQMMQSTQNLLSQVNEGAKKLSKKKEPELYQERQENWYKALPYAFRAKINGEIYVFYLPISPKNLNITTYFATNMVATLYSTVEEHSEQRYFDITISGTTGFAPQFHQEYGPFDDNGVALSSYESALYLTPSAGRKKYEIQSEILNEISGLFPKTVGKLQNALNQAGSAFNTVKSKFGASSNYEAGVFNNASGYKAFHALYKFLLKHKQSAAAGTAEKKKFSLPFGKGHSESTEQGKAEDSVLQFVNYKDNNQYSCVVNRFTLERSSENPMLYDYNISLRAYNLSPITTSKAPDLTDRFENLGLNSKMSYATTAKLAIKNGKSALSNLQGAKNSMGA
jgi:hypothetical protein